MTRRSVASTALRGARSLPPLVLGVRALGAVAAAWIVGYDIQPYFLPQPERRSGAEFVDNFDLVRTACTVTGANALIGLVLGSIARRSLVAVLTNRFRSLDELVDPLAVAVAAIPIVVHRRRCSTTCIALDSQIGRGGSWSRSPSSSSSSSTSPRACARTTRPSSS